MLENNPNEMPETPDNAPAEVNSTAPSEIPATPGPEETPAPAPEIPSTPSPEETPAPAPELPELPAEEPADTAADEAADQLLSEIIAETETADETEAPAETPAAEEESPEQEKEKILLQNEEQLKTVVKTILAEELKDFEKTVAACSLQELALLMEEVAATKVSKDNIHRVGKLKRAFDARYQASLDTLKENAYELDESNTIKAEYLNCSKRFTAGLKFFNKNKAEYENEQQKDREANSQKKAALLEELKTIVMAEDVNALNKVKEIREKWNEIGQPLQADADTFFQTYKTYMNTFYTLYKQYRDLKEESKKYNLEKKQKLIETLKKLIPEDPASVDARYWQESGELVRSLFEQWKTAGPVPRELSDELWKQFREVSDKFYEHRRQFFNQLDDLREENTRAKQRLLEKLKGFAGISSSEPGLWKEAADEIKTIQEEWRTIGPALQEVSDELYKQYRELTDGFFARRKGFLKVLDENRSTLLTQKEELLQQAEALQDSEDWTATAQQLKELQKKWNELGLENGKEGFKLRKKFRKVCDNFFARQKEHFKTLRSSEDDNLAKKLEILEQLDALAAADDKTGADDLIKAFDAIGHVPLAKKNEVNDRFRDLRRKLQPRAAGSFGGGQGGGSFRGDRNDRGDRGGNRGGGGINYSTASSGPKEEGEEGRIKRAMRGLDEELAQLENNILFLSKSKSSDGLRKEIQQKIDIAKGKKDRLQAELKELRKPKPEAPAAAENDAPAAENAAAETPVVTEAPAADATPTPENEE